MNLHIDDDVQDKVVEVTDAFLINVRKVKKTKRGKVVGCYMQNYWHSYVHKAFHIAFDDGTCGTFHATKVRFIKNEELRIRSKGYFT